MFNKKRLDDYKECINNHRDCIEQIQKSVNLLKKCDNYNTMYQEQADRRIETLEENLRLVYEYLGVRKEVFPEETLLVDDEDECEKGITGRLYGVPYMETNESLGCCDECGCELKPIDYVIDMIDMLNNSIEVLNEEDKKIATTYLTKNKEVKEYGKKFESLKKTK